MQAEERDLISGLFGRLKSFEAQPRDPEADRLIAGAVASQPGAPYLLVQTVLVQEQALKGAQQRIAELEAKAAQAPASGFLASAPRIGPWGRGSVPQSAPAQTPQMQQPMQQMQQPMGQPAGGGFLRQAMMTAAGVAGGALLFEGIRNMMGHSPGPFGTSTANAATPAPLMPQDQVNSADYARDDLAGDGVAADDYDSASSDSGFGGSDDDNV